MKITQARFEGCQKASTEWVAMFDDDILIPPNWLQSVLNEVDSTTGAVTTVHRQKDASLDTYYKVLSSFYHVDTGIYYKRYHYYSHFQLLRRLSARFLLGSFTPLVSHRLFTQFSLWRDDVKFLSGWLKETFKPP